MTMESPGINDLLETLKKGIFQTGLYVFTSMTSSCFEVLKHDRCYNILHRTKKTGEPPEKPKEELEEFNPEESLPEEDEEEAPAPDAVADAPTDGQEKVEEEAEDDEALLAEEKKRIQEWVESLYEEREKRRMDLEVTFAEIAAIVDRWKSASYDLGMVAGRQMSTTSGEFIVQSIEKDILAYIDEQIGILPDPDLKKKKAKPEEVNMIRQLLEQFLDENMEIIVKEVEEEEEEEEEIPEVLIVYAVPGIGPTVENEIMTDFLRYIKEMSRLNNDVTMPRNLRHFLCPPLEKFLEEKYDDEIHEGEMFKKPPPKRFVV